MTISLPEMVSLGAYFVIMMLIGLYAYRQSTSNISEYMLGGRQLHPAVGALSAGASDMSGWMLLGLPGAIFASGLGQAWIAVGLTIGAYLNYRFLAPRLRVYTEVADDSITIPDYLGNRFQDSSQSLRLLSAVVIIIFFTLYTSAGLVAGGKLFESAFGMNYHAGLFATAGVVLAYTVIGGFLAVSLTDFVQGCIMFIALVAVPIVTYNVVGGWPEANAIIQTHNPDVMSWFAGTTALGIISSMAWGLGYFGQPHIIVRFMAIRDLKGVATARLIGMSWMVVTVIGAVLVGLFGLAYHLKTGIAVGDPETIFIILAQLLFHPLIAGFLLAAILAAIMSTISSQLLVSSSSLTEDIYKSFFNKDASQENLVLIGRITTIIVSLIAILLAFDRSNNVLSLVGNAWAGFGAAFGPVMLLSLHWRGLTRNGALVGMLTGTLTVLLWLYLPVTIGGQTLSGIVYEIVPGFLFALVTAIAVSKLDRPPSTSTLETFNEVERIIRP